MTAIWNKIETLALEIERKYKATGESYSENQEQFDWHNSLYRSFRYRRAHIEIVDKRDSHGIYIVHSTIFPHFNDSSPIWGFDAICGRNKITGAFHDFSNAGDPKHSMIDWFAQNTSNLKWSKPRELPDWAKKIFSPNMIAAGNIQEELEIDLLCSTVLTNLDYYLKHVGLTQESGADYHMAQNRYCYYQKQNPQVVKSMVSMGIPHKIITQFVDDILFPETNVYMIV